MTSVQTRANMDCSGDRGVDFGLASLPLQNHHVKEANIGDQQP